MFLHSGSYDKIHQALSITRAAVANEMEVHLFFTFWALQRLVKGEMDKVVLEADKAQFTGLIEDSLQRGRVELPSQMLKQARESGKVKVYACSASMGILNISKDSLVAEVDKTMGFVSFLALVEDAAVTLYI